jgi:hypothetical protein
MTEEQQVPVPEWAKELAEAVADTIEFKAQAYLDCRQSAPEETDWGVDLVELWPAVMEIQEAGPNDGEMVFGIVDSFDLLAVLKLFERVDDFTFGYENDGRGNITIIGKFKGREVVVVVYFEPELDDDEDEAGGEE